MSGSRRPQRRSRLPYTGMIPLDKRAATDTRCPGTALGPGFLLVSAGCSGVSAGAGRLAGAPGAEQVYVENLVSGMQIGADHRL